MWLHRVVCEVLKICVRAERDGDAPAVERVTVAAFSGAGHPGPGHADPTEHLIVASLRDTGALALSLVAECDGELVGHLAASAVTISDGSTHWYGLGPVSVIPDYQGRGIGTRLVGAALERLRELGAAGCVLLGDPGYYGRFGFRAIDGLKYPGPPAEYFQALSLDGSMAQGVVTYHPAFDTQG